MKGAVMADAGKPLPEVTEETRPFWESAKRHALELQRCTGCGRFRYPVTTFCPACLSDGVEWTPVSGRGTVYSFVVMHQVYHPAFRDDVPYNVAAIAFEEGPRMYSNVVGCPNDAIQVGMPVEIVYDDVTDEVTLPKFRPA